MIVPEGWRRGTTPINIFNVDIDLTGCTIYLTYAQSGRVVIEKTGDQLEVTSDQIITMLTQEETLRLNESFMVEIQLRYIREDGFSDASNIITTQVGKILKDGVIKYV